MGKGDFAWKRKQTGLESNMKIKITVPDAFEGNLDQWEDVFFSFSTPDLGGKLAAVVDFCAFQGWPVTIKCKPEKVRL